MKRFFISLLCAVMVILCLPVLSASAAEEPLVGINGEKIDMTQGYASGKGWEMVFNRRDQIYTLTLSEGRFEKITSYGDLCLHIPAGANVTVGKSAVSYAIGVENGTLRINGTGNLTLEGVNGLIANNGHLQINGVNLSVSAAKYGIYTKNGSLTVNGGTVNTIGAQNGIFTTGGLYVNGGKVNASAESSAPSDSLADASAGINLQNCYAVISGGEVVADGYYAMFGLKADITVCGGSLQAKGNTYGLYTGPNPTEIDKGVENPNRGQCALRVTDGAAVFTGAKGGVYLCNNSLCEITGGELTANVAGGDVSYTAGLQLDKSDFRMTGGRLQAQGFNALNVNGLSDNAADGNNNAFELLGGSVLAEGSNAGLYLQYASATVDGGALKAVASKTQGIYIYNSEFSVGGGMLTAQGGAYGISAHGKTPRFDGGTVYADGNSYGIYCNGGGVVFEGGNITAVGGKSGVSVPGDILTVGISSASRVSLTAMGGELALAGKSIMAFGRTYNDPVTEFGYKIISYVDGAESYTSDTFCTLKMNGSPVDLVTQMAAAEQNVLYNDGGTAASYKWMLKKDSANGRYSLTLNGATLTGMEVTGALDIILNGTSSDLRGNMKLNNAYVRLDAGANTLSCVPARDNAMDLLSSVFVHKSGTLDVRGPIGAYASDLCLYGTVQANHRSETFSVSAGKVYLMDADISNSDATALFALNDTDLQAYVSTLYATGVAGYVFDAGDSKLLFDRCTLTANGGNGLYAKQIIANSSTLSVTGCVGRAFSVGNGGLYLYNSEVTADAQEEAVFSLGEMLFAGTDLRADSAEGVKAVLLSAPADSEAAITVTGHCLIKSGKEPVRIADANGVASYFANEDVALSSVYISNDHNFTQTETYMYCNQIGTGVMACTYTGCKTAMTKSLPETAHDFSNYVPNGDATCYQDGTKTATCPVCFEKSTVADVNSKTDHVFTTYISNGDADCLTDGTKTAKCDFCDVTDTQPDVNSALGHDRKLTEVKGDCQNNVWTSLVCSRCGDATEPVDTGRLGTCKWDESRGCLELRYCTVCGETDGMILMHAYSAFTSDNNASCTVNGTLSATCRRCGDKQTRPDPDAVASGHVDNEWVVVKQPTAFETGIKAMSCKNCPLYYNEKVMPVIVVPVVSDHITVDIDKSIVFITQEKMTAEQFKNAVENKENCILTQANGSSLDNAELVSTGAGVKITDNGQAFTVVVFGDADCDGLLSVSDARIALRAAVGLDTLTAAQALAADLSGSDGEITPADARTILRRAVGLK